MSRVVDERVVEMVFDNYDFERNVKTSMSTLDKLKQALKFDGAETGLDKISAAADRLKFTGLISAVDSVGQHFSALETLAFSVIANIGSRIADAGIDFLKSLSVDNIMSGWGKFEEKTKAVGTIIAQGYDMDTVSDQLERLNWYTDETSYNFTDMVSNIGKFTAAGQKLEPSVTAMEGIANWAALSGQNAQVASRAMYQLAQAMGAGYLRKIDWRSVQTANMDNVEIRKRLIESAIELGTLKKLGDDLYESTDPDTGTTHQFNQNQFEAYLSDLWITSDVMMRTFEKYASAVDDIYEYASEHDITASEAIDALSGSLDEFGIKAFRAAQEARTWTDAVESVKEAVGSGWMQTFEYIFGNYEEATKLFTDLANEMWDIFNTSAVERNAQLAIWKENFGGRDLLISGVTTGYEALKVAAESVSMALRDFFPKKTATDFIRYTHRLNNLTTGLKDFIGELTVGSEEGASAVSSATKLADFSLNGLLGVVKNVGTNLVDTYTKTGEASSGLAGTIENFGEYLVMMEEGAEMMADSADYFVYMEEGAETVVDSMSAVESNANKIYRTFRGLFAVVDIVRQAFKALGDTIKPLFSGTSTLASGILDITAYIGDWLVALDEFIKENDIFRKGLDDLVAVIKTIPSEAERIFKMAFMQATVLYQKFNDLYRLFTGFTLEETFGAISSFAVFAFRAVSDAVSKIDQIPAAFVNLVTRIEAAYQSLTGLSFEETFNRIAMASRSMIARIIIAFYTFPDRMKTVSESVQRTVGIIEEAYKSLTGLTFKETLDKITEGAVNLIKSTYEGLLNLPNRIRIIGVHLDVARKRVEAFYEKLTGLTPGKTFDILVDGAKRAVTAISNLISKIKEFVSLGFSGIGEQISETFHGLDLIGKIDFGAAIQKLMDRYNELGGVFGIIGNGFKEFLELLKGISTPLGAAVESIVNIVSDLFGAFVEGIKEGNFTKFIAALNTLSAAIGSADIVKMFEALGGGFNILAEGVRSFAHVWTSFNFAKLSKGFANLIPESGVALLNELTLGLHRMAVSVNAQAIKAIAVSIAILAASLLVLSLIDVEDLSMALVAVGASMLMMEKMMKTVASLGTKDLTISSLTLIGFATAMVIMASAVKKLSKLNWEEIAKGLLGMAGIVAALLVSIKMMTGSTSSFMGKDTPFSAFLENDKLRKERITQVVGALLALSIAISIMASAVKKLGEMKQEDLRNGTLAISVLITALGLFTKLASGKNMTGVAGTLLGMTVAILGIAAAIKILSTITNGDALFNSMVSFVVIVAMLTASLGILSLAIEKVSPLKLVGLSTALLAMGAAVLVVSAALKLLSTIGDDEMTRSLGALVTVIAALTFASVILKETFLGMGALAVGAAAILLIATAFGMLALIPATQMIVSLVSLAGALVILGVGAKVLGPLIPQILAFSAAIALLGVGVAGIGIGMTATATALTLFATSSKLAFGTLVSVIGELIAGLPALLGALVKSFQQIFDMKLLISLINLAMNSVFEVILNALRNVVMIIPEVFDILIQALAAIAKTIEEHGTELGNSLITILLWLLNLIGDHGYEIGEAVFRAIFGILEALLSFVPVLSQASFDLFIAIIDGFGEGLVKNAPRLREAIINLFQNIWKAILAFFGVHSPSTKFAELAKNCFLGFIKGVGDSASSVLKAIGNLMKDIVTKIGDWIGSFISKGGELVASVGTMMGDMVATIGDGIGTFVDKGGELVSAFIAGITGKTSELQAVSQNTVEAGADAAKESASHYYGAGQTATLRIESGIESLQGDLNGTAWTAMYGAKQSANSVSFYQVGVDAVRGMAQGIIDSRDQVWWASESIGAHALGGVSTILERHSPSKAMKRIGKDFTAGFIIGIESLSRDVTAVSENIGSTALDGVNDALGRLSMAVNNDFDITPTVRPIVDTSSLSYGAGLVGDIFGMSRAIDLSGRASMSINTDLADKFDGIKINNGSVVSAIEKMRGDISKLGDSITEMQLVMDTGALVGSIARPMDRTLGQRVVYAGRGM